MLPKTQKIHLDKEFDQIFKTGRSAYGRFLGVKALKNDLKINRFAVVLGLKVEKSAVRRHLLKRLIFNLIKKNQANLNFSADCVIIALAAIKTASKEDIDLEIKNLLKEISRTL